MQYDVWLDCRLHYCPAEWYVNDVCFREPSAALFNIELSQRLPRKASPYTYSHVCLGRFASFLTGWTLILEYAVAFALVAKSIGLYLDTLIDDAMQKAFLANAPLTGGEVLGTYFDFFGAAVVLLVGCEYARVD